MSDIAHIRLLSLAGILGVSVLAILTVMIASRLADSLVRAGRVLTARLGRLSPRAGARAPGAAPAGEARPAPSLGLDPGGHPPLTRPEWRLRC
jgi:hypothetical protein